MVMICSPDDSSSSADDEDINVNGLPGSEGDSVHEARSSMDVVEQWSPPVKKRVLNIHQQLIGVIVVNRCSY
jgi:hypothetical protein